MKRIFIFVPVLALALSVIAPKAHAQDETPGQQSQIVASVPPGGYSCGRNSYPLYCYGVPVNVGGTFWLDVYYNTGSGFILFNSVADLGQGTITSAAATTNSLGQVTQLTVTFGGSTNDGDGGTYTGTGTFTFSYYKCSSRYCGYIQVLQSGTISITYK
jgi:hypothetical protein